MKTRTSQIIVADDDKTVRTVIVQALSRQGYQVGAATTIAGLWDITTSGRGDVLITDVGFPDGDALELLPRLQEKRPDSNCNSKWNFSKLLLGAPRNSFQ